MKRRALLIGINNYHLLGGLKYARQDAEATADALRRYCDFTDQDITLMSCGGEGALLGLSRYIEHALMDLARCRDLGLLVFGFWGHGFAPQPGRRYLCGLDATEADLERTAVSFDVVKAKLAQVQAENTLLLLDCCQNRPAGRAAAAEPMTEGEEVALSALARDIQAAHREQQIDTVPTVAILNACREGQKAYEWDARGHGIFTAHLLDAFEQGFASIAPLSAWVFDRVTRSANELYHQPQTPYVVIEGKGDIPLHEAIARPARLFAPAPRRPDKPAVPPPPQKPSRPAARWWVVIDGREQGPLDDDTVRARIRDGSLTREIECWRDGMDAWRRIGETAEWADSFPPLPSGPLAAPPPRKPAVRLPDCVESVLDAEYAPVAGLCAGSKMAQNRQREWVEKGYPLEVVMKNTGMVFRLVPPGEFLMGTAQGESGENDEKPQHKVCITRPIYVGKFPVTQQQWQAVIGRNPAFFQTGKILQERLVTKGFWKETVLKEEVRLEENTSMHPVESVSWNDCQEFLNGLHDQSDMEFGEAFHLLTEAQWEYACRAGTTWLCYGELDDIAWHDGNSGGMTHPVGQKRPNAWGLYDMLGNIWEWCQDWYDENYYGKSPKDDPTGPESGSGRVLRGGSWFNRPRYLRSASRGTYAPDGRDFDLGVRVVLSVAGP